jgi:hypothetical protein
MFDINVMVLGLLHAVTALPCLRIRLRCDRPKTEKKFFFDNFLFGGIGGCWGVLTSFSVLLELTKYIKCQFFKFKHFGDQITF